MGKVISMFSREEIPQPREVPFVMDFFAESNFEEERWTNSVLRVTAREIDQVLGLLSHPFGFHEYGMNRIDPGEYNVRDKEAVIAVRAYPEDSWVLQCGFFVCVGGDWYFKREAGGNFEREKSGQRLFLKPNPRKFPYEE